VSDFRLQQTQVVPGSLPAVFAFFKRPANLERLTPPWLNFRILSSSDAEVRQGTRIRYRLRLNGIPLTWESLISRYEEGVLFVDEQIRGPYRRWVHLHGFREVPGGVEVSDRVEYALPFGPLGDLVHALVVRRQLNAIFAFRRRAMEEMFGTIEP
jgi:ligand-binding SRPBCC domain-containing protein